MSSLFTHTRVITVLWDGWMAVWNVDRTDRYSCFIVSPIGVFIHSIPSRVVITFRIGRRNKRQDATLHCAHNGAKQTNQQHAIRSIHSLLNRTVYSATNLHSEIIYDSKRNHSCTRYVCARFNHASTKWSYGNILFISTFSFESVSILFQLL